MSSSTRHSMPPYGVAIQSAIKTGDLPQMKTLLKQRDASTPENKELNTAYEQLAKEVARLEKH
ncbi:MULTISPECIES: DUF1843 domain-containing protein [Gammaproteobacteria]|uniref:DUF1843 domain-containing protein n=1 Tax=Gammaproteobacteria TaxID=1236 RepID=UPI00191495BC|nr:MULTISPECIES: DUF1843 domain-containing protein [Gammaproteobacteria]MBK5302082.1 DUF1843 domain-containing protein [Bacillus sp. TH86]MBK5321851.1 DUF1843 domain-containing protein [Bacillus sp. TH59]MBK5336801.1 DUF1843 domain-containing protein [Bacillus sp. TH57]MBK5310864.1 DUF1843 domain-containing protein [Pseudomonas sp. TH71]MBK5316348.1 DUF1843 domain-containing protein [Erwinia sp. TH79]